MSAFNKIVAKKRQEFFSHVSAECLERLDRPEPITPEEYRDLSANSYERRLIYAKLDDAALLEVARYTYENSQFSLLPKYAVPSSYNDALTGVLLPLLLGRFRVLLNQQEANDGS